MLQLAEQGRGRIGICAQCYRGDRNEEDNHKEKGNFSRQGLASGRCASYSELCVFDRAKPFGISSALRGNQLASHTERKLPPEAAHQIGELVDLGGIVRRKTARVRVAISGRYLQTQDSPTVRVELVRVRLTRGMNEDCTWFTSTRLIGIALSVGSAKQERDV